VRLAVAFLAAAALVVPPGAAARALLPHGKSIAVYASVRPIVILFGDTVRVDVTVLVDGRKIDPRSVRVRERFAPFQALPAERSRQDLGSGVVQIHFRIPIRCLVDLCVPKTQEQPYRFPQGRLDYRLRSKPRALRERRFRLTSVEVISRINPVVFQANLRQGPTIRIPGYQAHIVPLPAASYRIPARWAAAAALALAALVAAGGALFGRRWVRERRPPPAEDEAVARVDPLEGALALVDDARLRGDHPLLRKALERVAAELGGANGEGQLALDAHRLAWADPIPPPAEVEAFTGRVRDEASR
jgi:hypothetical protein